MAMWNQETNTFLATLPRTCFNNNTTVSIRFDSPWSLLSMDGLSADSTLAITNLTSETSVNFSFQNTTGPIIQAKLMFTFLPLVQLQGSFGYEYQPATFILSHPDSVCSQTLPANIKWRGGSTNAEGKHKRNYKVKFSDDYSFFGLRSDNNWMLDAGQADVFRLRNRIAMDLWNSMATSPYYAVYEPKARNGVRGIVVELFLDNEYRGIYNFSEMMDRKQLKLKKISNTGQIRGCLYKSVSWNKTKMFDFINSYDNSSETLYGFEMKYPDLSDSDTLDWMSLVAAINFVASSTDTEFQQQVNDYFDMPVVMDYNIFFNVVNAVDNGGKNIYWAVYDKTASQCLTLAPWDLDATFGQRWGGQLVREIQEGYYNSPLFRLDLELLLTYRMYRDNFDGYIDSLNARYHQLRQPGQPFHTDSILALVTRYYTDVKNSGAAQRETARWSGDSDLWGDTINFDAEYAYICDWIRQRMDFIDRTELPLFYNKSYFEELADIEVASSFQHPRDNQMYDLHGRRVTGNTKPKPGIYVRNGRKIVIR
ncbi:MAG: CotH kinase family protein [Prevotella sp.]|nr:CotH kinase family protein [Prevotella sp.]